MSHESSEYVTRESHKEVGEQHRKATSQGCASVGSTRRSQGRGRPDALPRYGASKKRD